MSKKPEINTPGKGISFWLRIAAVPLSYLLTEAFAALLLRPTTGLPLAFGLCWAAILSAITLCLPRLPGRIFYGLTYFFISLWTIAQTGYDQMFSKLMWLTDIRYAAEGAGYINVLLGFSWLWWISIPILITAGVLNIIHLPQWRRGPWSYSLCGLAFAGSILGLCLLPQAIYMRDNGVWGTHSEYGQSTSARANYRVMYDAQNVYDLCGIYQLTVKDVWKHSIYPLTPAYRQSLKQGVRDIDQYFIDQGQHQSNEMTGIFEGKNVILVLMESMDDWMITQEETPTLCRLMDEGISFTNFYTPGYGSVRTFNTEFCINTGTFLPTNGSYAFNYVTNHYDQSLANRLKEMGYSAECFHYNTDSFYSRGVFEPSMGYNSYISYEDYTEDEDALFDDELLFDLPAIRDLFFREGPTFNFIITRSAHLSYQYNEVLSDYALRQYPQYRGRFGHEEEDCARVKAKLVDDMFARLLEELEAEGQLENTVIIGVTDHYTYGFKDIDKLMELCEVEDTLLLERTPCFIWSPGCPDLEMDKTLNTSDLLPTVLNMVGCDRIESYLGRDAFDDTYMGWVPFPDGSWIAAGIVCQRQSDGDPVILQSPNGETPDPDFINNMTAEVLEFIRISNLLLETNYYRTH